MGIYLGNTKLSTANVIDVPINNQSKTVTPTTSQQTVTPDTGYTGLSQVTVNAAPLQSKTVTPKATQQTVTPTSPNIGLSSVTVNAAPLNAAYIVPTTYDQYVYPGNNNIGLSQVTVYGVNASIDPNIQPQNIVSGVSILGVVGTASGGGGGGTVDPYPSSNNGLQYEMGGITITFGIDQNWNFHDWENYYGTSFQGYDYNGTLLNPGWYVYNDPSYWGQTLDYYSPTYQMQVYYGSEGWDYEEYMAATGNTFNGYHDPMTGNWLDPHWTPFKDPTYSESKPDFGVPYNMPYNSYDPGMPPSPLTININNNIPDTKWCLCYLDAKKGKTYTFLSSYDPLSIAVIPESFFILYPTIECMSFPYTMPILDFVNAGVGNFYFVAIPIDHNYNFVDTLKTSAMSWYDPENLSASIYFGFFNNSGTLNIIM